MSNVFENKNKEIWGCRSMIRLGDLANIIANQNAYGSGRDDGSVGPGYEGFVDEVKDNEPVFDFSELV